MSMRASARTVCGRAPSSAKGEAVVVVAVAVVEVKVPEGVWSRVEASCENWCEGTRNPSVRASARDSREVVKLASAASPQGSDTRHTKRSTVPSGAADLHTRPTGEDALTGAWAAQRRARSSNTFSIAPVANRCQIGGTAVCPPRGAALAPLPVATGRGRGKTTIAGWGRDPYARMSSTSERLIKTSQLWRRIIAPLSPNPPTPTPPPRPHHYSRTAI